MRQTREFKVNPVSRALLEAETRSLWRQIKNNEDILIRPFSTFYSAILLPVLLYQFLLKGDFFKDIRENLQEQHRQVFSQAVTNRYAQEGLVSSEEIAQLQRINKHGRNDMREFEKMLLEVPIHCPEPEPVIWVLQRRRFPQATTANYVSILRSIPSRMRDLIEIKDDGHLLHYTAALIDWLHRSINATRLINRYHTIYSVISSSAPPELIAAERQILPVYPGTLIPISPHPSNTTCIRYAELIHLLIPYYYQSQERRDFYTAPYVLNRLGTQILWLSIGLSLFLHFTFTPQLLKKIASYSRLLNSRVLVGVMKYFLPMGWYLDRPLTVKNYRFLATEELIAEKNLLTKSLAKQAPYVKKGKILDKLLTGFFLLYCVFNFLFTGTWSDQTFVLISILTGVSLKNIYTYGMEKCTASLVARRLGTLAIDLQNIFSLVMQQYFIVQVERDEIALSYITIQVLNKYADLPEKHLATVIKNVLNHFDVQISTHDATNISVAADTRLHGLDVIKNFFHAALAASVAHYQLGLQLKPMAHAMSSNIILEPAFLDPTQPSWLISAAGLFAPPSANPSGVAVDGKQITIQRQKPFSKDELAWLKKTLSSAEQKAYIGPASTMLAAKSKKSKRTAQDMKSAESPMPPQIPTPPLSPIVWPIAGVIFPNNTEVKPLINAPHRFMLFCLPLGAFGDNQEARDIFYAKSTQMARSGNNSHGIKHGDYLGTDFFTGRQRRYQGRVKVLGKYGNSGVLLDIEAASNGSLLYQTRSFATGIHS